MAAAAAAAAAAAKRQVQMLKTQGNCSQTLLSSSSRVVYLKHTGQQVLHFKILNCANGM
jgi:predicted regulator of Ras-like GTPase activity (Roadblock/LC7/MglB family)